MIPEEFQKKVDEDWKERAQREKDTLEQRKVPSQGHGPVSTSRPAATDTAPNFGTFVSSLAMQTLMALGEAPNPSTNQPQIDLEQARYLIDLLGILQEKTKGNLRPEETELLEGALYELRMKYVSRKKTP